MMYVNCQVKTFYMAGVLQVMVKKCGQFKVVSGRVHVINSGMLNPHVQKNCSIFLCQCREIEE